MNTTETLGEAALWYAEHGIPVLPLRPRTKLPLTGHGYTDATSNIEIVKQWWADNPDANIGIPTGAMSGLIALDIDPRNGGTESFAQLIEVTANCAPRSLRRWTFEDRRPVHALDRSTASRGHKPECGRTGPRHYAR